jgi:hypothetical protein
VIFGGLKTLRMATGLLAIFAALAFSILPAGLMPKVAGRCGRALCNCAPEPAAEVCSTCHSAATPVSASRVFTLAETAINSAEAPGTALQIVFSGVVAPRKLDIVAPSNERDALHPESRAFAMSSVASEIQTPPPRA